MSEPFNIEPGESRMLPLAVPQDHGWPLKLELRFKGRGGCLVPETSGIRWEKRRLSWWQLIMEYITGNHFWTYDGWPKEVSDWNKS